MENVEVDNLLNKLKDASKALKEVINSVESFIETDDPMLAFAVTTEISEASMIVNRLRVAIKEAQSES